MTIVKAIQKALPHESILYFGDTVHLPYGEKSAPLVQGYAGRIGRFLLEEGVKAVVIACNTASAVAADHVRQLAGGTPVFDVIAPAVEEALSYTHNHCIGLIGTRTTVNSGVYSRQIQQRVPHCRVIEKATSLLVPMIEEGWLHNRISRDVIEAYMSDTGFREVDSLILGCTHYPLIKDEIAHCLQQLHAQEVRLVDSSQAVARSLQQGLETMDLLAPMTHTPSHRYYLSDYTTEFEAAATLFLGYSVRFFQKQLNLS